MIIMGERGFSEALLRACERHVMDGVAAPHMDVVRGAELS